MQKIQKFQSGRLYAAPKSTRTYELINRDGHRLVFRVRNPKNNDSWKQLATSTFQADETGAFETVLFLDGIRLRADAWCSDPKKVRRMSLENLVGCYIHLEGYTDLRSIYNVLCQEYPGEFDRKQALETIRKVLKEERA